MSKKETKYESEAIVHHIHHKNTDDGYRREININGNIFSVSLSSDDPEENMDYLSGKSMEILKQLKEEHK